MVRAYRLPQLLISLSRMSESRSLQSAQNDIAGDRPRRPRFAKSLPAVGGLALAVGLAFFLVGFALFVANVNGQADRVATVGPADGIVVLTGGRARLESAVELLRAKHGVRLLVSGVHADIDDDTLRRTLGVSTDLFNCCIDVDRTAMDTIGNAKGSAAWADLHGYGRLIVVTNDYHVPRSMLEMRRALPDRALTAYPVVNEKPVATDLADWLDRYRVLAGEYAKYLVAQARGLSI